MMAVVICGRILINVTRYVSQVVDIGMVFAWIMGVPWKGVELYYFGTVK